MGLRGTLRQRDRRWLWERDDDNGDGIDDGDETDVEDTIADAQDDSDPTGSDSSGPGQGPGRPGNGNNNNNKGPGKPPSPPGQAAKTSISTTSAFSTTLRTSEQTTKTTSSISTTSSIESTRITTTSSEESTTFTFSKESTTSTSSSSILLTSSTPLPLSTFSPTQISSFSFASPPTTFPLVSTTAFSTPLSASSIPFSTLSQVSMTPTVVPVVFTPPPQSSTALQSNGNANLPSIVPTSKLSSSRTSTTSSSPSAIGAAYGISSGKSAPTATVIGIGVSIGVVTVIISGLLLFFLRRRKKDQTYLDDHASVTTSQSFWDRVTGLPHNLRGRPAPSPEASIYGQNFNSYSPHSPPPVQRQYDTSSSNENVEMPPPALFIPTVRANAAPNPPPVFTNQPYSPPAGAQQPLRLNPVQPYGTTTTIRTGPLSLSWFLGKPSKIPVPSPKSPKFIPPTGYGQSNTNTNADNQDVNSRLAQMEADMQVQEQRWESSRREMAQRQSGLIGGISQPNSNSNLGSHNRQTLQSEGWESGIGDARSARYLSGLGSESTGRGSVTIQDARLDFIQPVMREHVTGLHAGVVGEMSTDINVEREKKKIETARRAKWESSPDSLNELPRWRDPVLSIFEEVRGMTSGDLGRDGDGDGFGGGRGHGPVSPRRIV